MFPRSIHSISSGFILRLTIPAFIFFPGLLTAHTAEPTRETLSLNPDWRFLKSDPAGAEQPGFDGQTNEPAVHLTLDSAGARIFKDVTRDNVGKRMAILLIEKGKGEVVTAPVIRTEIGGGRVQISGRMTTSEANDTALLLRAGSLAAPMDIIEERTIGPSAGAENIQKGFHSTLWGFVAIAVFMCLYYVFFGAVSTVALCANVLLLIALLSIFQAWTAQGKVPLWLGLWPVHFGVVAVLAYLLSRQMVSRRWFMPGR